MVPANGFSPSDRYVIVRGFSCIRHASLTLTAILGTYSEDGRWYLSASSPVDLPCECATSYLSAPQVTGSDIPYPPLPHPKAVLAGLTPEGIYRGQTEHPFPEPAAGSRRPCLTTLRTGGLSHGVRLYVQRVTRSYTAIATWPPSFSRRGCASQSMCRSTVSGSAVHRRIARRVR